MVMPNGQMKPFSEGQGLRYRRILLRDRLSWGSGFRLFMDGLTPCMWRCMKAGNITEAVENRL